MLAATHQTWLRDPVSGQFLFDVFREPHDGGTWICRRDESLRLPYDAIIERTAEGIPYLVPELVLLFKAKAARPKDQADFVGTLPLLSRARRSYRVADARASRTSLAGETGRSVTQALPGQRHGRAVCTVWWVVAVVTIPEGRAGARGR